MTFLLVLVFIGLPMLAFELFENWRGRRRMNARGQVDGAEPMSWRSPRDAAIMVVAALFLVVGFIGILATRSAVSG